MSYTQLKQPNLSVVGQEGLCLAYVTEVFGVAPHYPSATVAWQNALALHPPNEQPPPDVAVPVWFSYNGPDGHVAVSVPGKGIYSTTAQGDKVFPSVAALVIWMGESMTYLGWSEDINNVKIVEGADMPSTVDANHVDSLAHAYLNDSLANNPGLQQYVGQTFEQVIAVFNGAPERAAYLKSIQDMETELANFQSGAKTLTTGIYEVK